MAEGILYERYARTGSVVRIRRTSAAGASPVTLVLELDRRTLSARSRGGARPQLMEVDAASEREARGKLERYTADDDAIERLLRKKGVEP